MYYLIENIMGFETIVTEGSRESLELQMRNREEELRKIEKNFQEKARYYVVSKLDWDIHNCPIMPVDLS